MLSLKSGQHFTSYLKLHEYGQIIYIFDKRIRELSNTWSLNKTGEGITIIPWGYLYRQNKEIFNIIRIFRHFCSVCKDVAAIFPGSSFGIYICIWTSPCEDCPKRASGGRYCFFSIEEEIVTFIIK